MLKIALLVVGSLAALWLAIQLVGVLLYLRIMKKAVDLVDDEWEK